jgi:hypothetical protein
LAEQVIDGRTLNIPKAVALYDDVIQLSNGDLLFGRINFEQNGVELADDGSFTLNCNGTDKPFLANLILKI